ncbi:DUF3486 family protein [Pacificibacter sp. AS14]|uniref:DUF3486 family protein n=1 Tax=Pacificibacter sp. AS14 TaxID=3135785 RepID=UPI00316E0DA8
MVKASKSKGRKGRGRLSLIDQMPDECDPIITWAASELSDREKTQTDIYAEFVQRCEELMTAHRGELEFDIPSFSSFNRYSMRQAKMTRRMDETRQIVSALSDGFDAKDSDDLTIIAAETLKSLIFHMLADTDADDADAKDVMHMASAFRQSVQAQSMSSARRQKVEEFEAKAGKAVEAVAKARGLTKETSDAILEEFLGVKL